MKKKLSFLCICICVCLSACQRTVPEHFDDLQTIIQVEAFTDALMEAQENRLIELTENMQQYIGSWQCEELILKMAIGQDSTRSLLGIDLLGVNIEILEDFTARINGEDYDVSDVKVTDQSWYSTKYAIVPQHADGLIIEIYYKHNEKFFSAYFAENGLSFCSYAYGYYSAKRLDDSSGPNDEVTEGAAGSQVADMVREAYLHRFGEGDQQLSQMLGTYYGYECVIHDNFVAHEGEHSLDIRMEGDKLQMFLDEEALVTEQVHVFSSKSRRDVEDPFLQELEISVEDKGLLKTYQEHYIIVLGSKESPVVLLVKKHDQEDFQSPPAITAYRKGTVYDFYD